MITFSFVFTINDKKYLKEALDSILSQSYKNFEIICINNILEDIDDYIAQYKSDKRLQFIDVDSSHNFSYLKNYAIENSSGDYICFLSSENILVNNNVLNEMSFFIEKEYSNIVSFNTKYVHVNNKDKVYDSIFKSVGYDKLEHKKSEEYETPLILSKNFFKKDFILKSHIKFNDCQGSDELFLIRALTNNHSYLTIPKTFNTIILEYDDNSECKILTNYVISYKNILNVLSCIKRFLGLLERLSDDLLKLKNINVSHFNVKDFRILEEDILYIIDYLTEYNFSFSYKTKKVLRYIHNKIYNKVTKFDVMVSIIIPTYNVEKYFDECMISIFNQTFQNFEVIIVDDSSTDSTVNIIKYYEQLDYRVKFIKKDRKCGSGGSRNLGLEYARGKYILFVDSDDWIDSNTLEKCVFYAEKYETDMIMFKLINYQEDEKIFFKSDYFTISILNDYNNSLFNLEDLNYQMFGTCVTPMNKLYSRIYLDSINAVFPEHHIHQDNPFFYQVFCEAEKVYLLDEFLYNRRLRENSITTLIDDTQLGTIEIIEDILNVFINNTLYDKYKTAVLNLLIRKLRNRSTEVSDEYLEEYFIRAKKKLLKLNKEYGLRKDFEDNLYEDMMKYYESVLYAEDYEDFLARYY